MKKRTLIFASALLAVICLIGVFAIKSSKIVYNASDFIGKTSAQIEAEFGLFDCCGISAGADGLYRSTSCGYTIKEARVGFFGTDPERLVFISFDENGVAHDTYEGNRPGG